MVRVSKKKIKKSGSKEKVTKIVHESTKEIKVEKALIENFIAFQKVMINLSVKFDNLSEQIKKLLEIFDIAAKSLAKKDFEPEKDNKDRSLVMKKLDTISEQAGLIGKGLALIHETNPGRYEKKPAEVKPLVTDSRRYGREPVEVRPLLNEPAPVFKKTAPEVQGYQKSIGSDTIQSSQPINKKTRENR